MKKSLKFIILAIFLLFFLTGCEEIDENKSDDSIKSSLEQIIVENGEIVLPLTNFKTLNPIYTDNLYYFHFSKLIYEGLFEYDENLQPVPRLAESYTVSDDGMNLEIKLKENVLFHDGTELTSDDVVFTFNILKNAGADSIYNILLKNAYGENNNE